MPYDIDTEPVVIKVPSAVALPPGNITPAEWVEYKSRVVAIEGLGLVDLSDVDADGLVDGQTLIYDEDDEVWKPGLPAGTISSVLNASGSPVVVNAARLQFADGLAASQHSTDATRAVVRVNMGGSGTSNSLARVDHNHSAIRRANKAASLNITLSSGTMTIDSATVTQLNPDIAYLIEATMFGDVRGAGTGAGEVTPFIRFPVGGVQQSTQGYAVRTVAGVDRPYIHMHDSAEVTGVTSVEVQARMQFTSGDPTLIKSGRIKVRAIPRR